VYAASEGLQAILVEQKAPGGQAGTSSLIENYLGFPAGVTGADLASRGYPRDGSAPNSCWHRRVRATRGSMPHPRMSDGKAVVSARSRRARRARTRYPGIEP
jgi:hypothetical protein